MNVATCLYSDPRYERPNVTLHALRQLHSEQIVGDFVDKQSQNAYELVVAIGSDIVLNSNIHEANVRAAMANDETLYVSPNCDACGYTNGFYMGSAKAVAAAMRRFDSAIQPVLNYEAQLKVACDAARLDVRHLEGHSPGKSLIKIRHNGEFMSLEPDPPEFELGVNIKTCLTSIGLHPHWKSFAVCLPWGNRPSTAD
jgi:hypothetical protein